MSKKYPVKHLEFILDTMFGDNTNWEKRSKLITATILMAGLVPGIPFSELILSLLKLALGEEKFGKAKRDLYNQLGKTESGRWLAKTLMYGAGHMAGVDISRRTGLGGVIPQRFADAFGPVFGRLGNGIWDIAQLGVNQDNYIHHIKNVSPGLGNILTAINGQVLNAYDRGRVNETYNTADRVRILLGFSPLQEAMKSDFDKLIKSEVSLDRKNKEKSVDAFIRNQSPENKQRLIEAYGDEKKAMKAVKTEQEKKGRDKLQRRPDQLPKDKKGSYDNIKAYLD